MRPRLSVVLPVRDGERTVERASVRHELVILALLALLFELTGSALRGRRSLGP